MIVRIRRRNPSGDDRSSAPDVGTTAEAAPPAPRLTCRLPFTEVAVYEDGAVYPNCCRDWVKMPLGNLREQSWDEVWNGEQAQSFRRSMLDGDLRYCEQDWCPNIQAALHGIENSTVAPIDQAESLDLPEEARAGAVEVTSGPSTVAMHYDRSCNLACPTCRDDITTVVGWQAEEMRDLHEIVVRDLLGDARDIVMTGTGDPFASKFMRGFLTSFDAAEYPQLTGVTLLTNALMFTPEMWARMPGLADVNLDFDISIDAATAETYEVVRWPGRWDQLQQSMDFIIGLPNLRNLSISMTVSRLNYPEIVAFAGYGERLAARAVGIPVAVLFKQLRRWETHTDSDWARVTLETLETGEMDVLREQVRQIEAMRARLGAADGTEGGAPGPGRLHEIRSNLDPVSRVGDRPAPVQEQPIDPDLLHEARRSAAGRDEFIGKLTAWNAGSTPCVVRCGRSDEIVSLDSTALAVLGPRAAGLVGQNVVSLTRYCAEELGPDVRTRSTTDKGISELRYFSADGVLRARLRGAVVENDDGSGTTILFALQRAE